jgi:hypothetical protein
MSRPPNARRTTLVIAVTVLALATTSAHADTDGFAFGVGLHTNSVGNDTDRTDAPPGSLFLNGTGAGAELWAGYGFTPSFSMRLFFAGAEHSTSDGDVKIEFGGATIEAMYLFRNPEVIRPYLVGGLGGYSVASRVNDYDYETTGPGLVLGTGLQCFFNDTVAIDVGLRGEFIHWEEASATRTTGGSNTQVRTPLDEEGGALKFVVGTSFWF